MTQWRRSDNDACTLKGRATVVQKGTTESAVVVKVSAESGAVNTYHSEDDRSTTVMNGKVDAEVEVLLKTETGGDSVSAGEAVSVCDLVEDMAQNLQGECLQKLEGGACDIARGGVSLIAESSEVVMKSDVETPVVVSVMCEPDRPPLSPPSIVLELPQTIDHPVTSEVTSSDSQLPQRPPKLQLQIHATTCSQPAARKSPVTVQEWVDSLPLHQRSEEEGGEDLPLEEPDDHLDLGLGAEAGLLYDVLPAVNIVSPAEPHPSTASVNKIASAARLAREPSVQSDVTSHTGSHCSSVESYLESRRPDPEEVLLGLGFGGPGGGAGGVDTEVSRIPRRFLQPSKVKGVAIDDFLRYQQDLIETFESGFCGYRGLTGSSHTPPSVIVAKIMEKLREHERENIPPGSVASAPVIGTTIAASPTQPTASSKFSRAARRVLTRTTVLGALPFIARQQQQQQQSVLTPDNRRFLDSQGSKSPEVPRKRMIIGHRSYTFGCDGDLIELEPITPTTPTPTLNFPPKPKPFLHKDSVLSTATSLSFTSIDSDSDTDDQSSSFGIQPRRNIVHDPPPTSTPKSTSLSSPDLSQDSVSEKPMAQRVYPSYPIVSKRMSSTSLSSWESEPALSPMNSCFDFRLGIRHLSTDEPVAEDQDDEGLRMVTKHYSRLHSSPDSPLSVSWPLRYESIDEDAEMKSDKSASLLSTSASEQSQDIPTKATTVNRHLHCHDINEEQQIELNNSCTTESNDVDHSGTVNRGDTKPAVDSDFDVNNISTLSGVQKSTKTQEQQVQIQKDVISLLQIRRGSLKRQQRILDDEEPLEVLPKDGSEIMMENMSGSPHKETQSLAPVLNSQEQDVEECVCGSDVFLDETSALENSRVQQESHENQCLRNAEEEPITQDTQNVEMIQIEHTGLPLRVENLSNNLNSTKEQAGDEVQLKYAEKAEGPQNTDLLRVVSVDTKGDSFEMEEICTYGEEEGRTMMLSRARSDSSGFLDGDSEICSSRHNGHNIDSMTTNLESSQHVGSSGTNSEVAQMTSDASETPRGDLEVTNVPSCTSSDILKSELVVSDGKSEPMECQTDVNLASPTKECVQKSETGLGAITEQNLPNNLFQELSSVNNWLDQCNVPRVGEHICDLEGSCGILHERQRPLANNLLENVNLRGECEEKNIFVSDTSIAEEATAYNFSILNKASPCGQSAITPGVQNITYAYQDSSSDRALSEHPIPAHQPTVCTDEDSVRQRTMSLHSIDHKDSLLLGGVRRVRSAPHCLEHLASGDLMQGSSWSSVSNMFSFCSDESVIHVGLQKGRTNEKRSSDACASALHKPGLVSQDETGFSDMDTNTIKQPTDSTGSTQYLKPCAYPYRRNMRRSSSDIPSASNRSVKDLHELVGELADRGWDIAIGTDSSHFACHTDQQLLRLQGDAVRAGLAAYGRQLVGGQADEQNGSHEVAEANKELQAVREVQDRIAAELRRVADLLEEQPLHRAANITGQMAVLLREQTRLCRQLEALSCESSPSIFVEPAPCCSVLDAVREENRHLQNMVERNSQELKEIRLLLKELMAVRKSQN